MSKSSVTQQEVDAVVAAYRKARTDVKVARAIADAAQAKAAKADYDYGNAVYAVEAARATDEAGVVDAAIVDAAITDVNIANAKVTTAAAAFDKASVLAKAAEAALEKAFEAAANVYLGPQQEDEE